MRAKRLSAGAATKTVAVITVAFLIVGGLMVAPAWAADPTASAPDLATASDSGNGYPGTDTTADNITNDDTPTFQGTVTGTVDQLTRVRIYRTTVSGNEVIAEDLSLEQDGTNAYKYEAQVTVPLIEGAHTVFARASKGLTDYDPSTNLSITIDKTAPPAPAAPDLNTNSDSGNSNTDNITKDNTPTLDGTIKKADGTVEPNAKVELLGGPSTLSSYPDGTGSYSFTPSSNLADGKYDFTVKVTDLAGNASRGSAATSVTIDTSIEPPTIKLADSSDTGTKLDNKTTDDTPTLEGTAEDKSTVAVVITGCSKDPITLTTTAVKGATDNTGKWSVTVPDTKRLAGMCNIVATSTDAAGNSGTSMTLPLTVGAGLVASVPSLTDASDKGWDPADNVTNDRQPTIEGTTSEAASVTIKIDGVEVAQRESAQDANGNYVYRWTPSFELLNKTYEITATATKTNSANDVEKSPESGKLMLTIDTVAPLTPSSPDMTSDSGDANDNYTSDRKPIFQGSASGEKGYRASLMIRDAGQKVVAQGLHTDTDSDGSSYEITPSYPTTGLGDGAYTAAAQIEDRAGNKSAASAPLSITIDGTNPDVPGDLRLDATTNSGATNDNVTTHTEPIIVGKAENGATVTLTARRDDGTAVITASGQATTNGFSIKLPALPYGGYQVTAMATDKAGNQSGTSTALALSIMDPRDVVGPPTVGGTNPKSPSTSETPRVWGAALAGTTVKIYNDAGCTTAGRMGSGSASDFNDPAKGIQVTVPANSETTFHATATDAEGNESRCSAGFKYIEDSIKPTKPAAPELRDASDTGVSASDNLTNDTTPTFIGETETGSTVTVLVNGITKGTQRNTDTTYSVTTTELSDGEHSITVNVTDAAGNVSDTSDPLTVTIDTDPPATTLESAPGGTTTTDSATFTFSGSDAAGFSCSLDAATFSACSSPITYSNLADGSHTFQVRAHDAAGNPDPTPARHSWTQDTGDPDVRTLTLAPARDKVRYGRSVVLSGMLSSTGTACTVDGTSIEIRRLSGEDGEFTTVGVATSNADGAFEFGVTPSANSEYIAIAAGEGDCAQATSPVVDVSVASDVVADASATNVRRGSKVKISGIVRPAHPNSTVKLQRRRSGRWVTIGTDELDGASAFSFTKKVRWDGERLFRVTWPSADDDHVSGSSKRIEIRSR